MQPIMIHLLIRTSAVFISIFILCSCKSEEVKPDPVIEASGFSVTIPNHPTQGQVLGEVQVTSNRDDYRFAISSQTPANAMVIDPATGAITVNTPSLFDFHASPSVTGTVTVSVDGVSDSANIRVTIGDELSKFEQETVSYFSDIALGTEFGNTSEITRRWVDTMKIFVGGTTSPELISELNGIVNEINNLVTTGFKMKVVSDTLKSNYYIYFGSGKSFADKFPAMAGFVDANFGLFTFSENQLHELVTGVMYVDIFRASLVEQKHLLREELTQSLGLAKDADLYPASIFQAAFSTKTTQYAAIDKELIRLLYHPQMKVGLNKDQVDSTLRAILVSE